MDIIIISILIVLAILLTLIAFFKKQIVILLFAGITFIFLGVGLWSGVSQSVTVVLQNSTLTTVSFVTNNINDAYSSGAAVFFIMIGLFLLIVSAVSFLDPKSALAGGFNDDE